MDKKEDEFYENSYSKPRHTKVYPMRLPAPRQMSYPEFHKNLLTAKTLRSKLAICFHKMSQEGMFSDAPPELWQLREEVKEHLPDGIR